MGLYFKMDRNAGPKLSLLLAIMTMLAGAGYFLVSGVGRLLKSIGTPEVGLSVLAPRPPSPAIPVTEEGARNARPILDRNPFDSTSPRRLDTPAAPDEAGAQVPPACAEAAVVDLARIRRRNAFEFDVDKTVVDKVFESTAEQIRVPRIVPSRQDRARSGVPLFCVRPNTLLGALGFERDDRILRVNGFDITHPEKALEAYGRLRDANHLAVQVNRRGRNATLNFNIR